MYVGNSTCVYLPPPEALWSKSHNSDKFNRYQALKRQFTQTCEFCSLVLMCETQNVIYIHAAGFLTLNVNEAVETFIKCTRDLKNEQQ